MQRRSRVFHPRLGLALASILGVVACRHETTPHRPRIGLVMKSLANEFFVTMEAGARRHHAAHAGDYDLIINGIKDEQDVGKQTDLVEQTVTLGADAVVIAPADSRALIAACRRAIKDGVVVVNIDNRLDAAILRQRGLSIPFVGPDNRKGAALAGEHLASVLPKGAAVAIIDGLSGAFGAQQRHLGFEDAIGTTGLRLLSAQAGNWDMAKANVLAAGIVSEHPDVKGFMVANDNMALGVVSALKAAGREKDVRVVSFDNIAAVQTLIRKDEILATVDQHADNLAVFGIEYALEILRTRTPPRDRETPIDLVTKRELAWAEPQ